MCLPENVLKSAVEKDLFALIKSDIIDVRQHKYAYIKLSRLYRLFIENYGFKYQFYDKTLIHKGDVLNALRRLNVCSPFKFKRKNPKRCKIRCRKII